MPSFLPLLIFGLLSSIVCVGQTSPNYNRLVWADECSGSGAIDTNKWFHQTQLPSGGNWYNGEIQHYTNRVENAFLSNGFMSIVAKRENFTDQGHTKQFTSARLNSKFAFTYGRVDVRAKLPIGVGTWPAIWMLGKNISEPGAFWETLGFGTTSWPACGEIDIMEHWGSNQNFVQSAMHTPSSFGGTVNHGGQFIATASTSFHIYSMVWTPNFIEFSVDGTVHYTYNPPVKNASTWPFNQDQYLLLNIAIQPSIHPNFQQSAMEIDYVRIYQQGATNLNELATLPVKSFYPNPVVDELALVFDQPLHGGIYIDIYHIDGRLVESQYFSDVSEQLTLKNLDKLSSGVYLVAIQNNGKASHIKMIKR